MTFKPLPTHNYTVRAEPEQDLNYQENTMKIQSLDKIKGEGGGNSGEWLKNLFLVAVAFTSANSWLFTLHVSF